MSENPSNSPQPYQQPAYGPVAPVPPVPPLPPAYASPTAPGQPAPYGQYAQPVAGYAPAGYPSPAPARPSRPKTLGVIALVVAIVAIVGSAIACAVAGVQIGAGIGPAMQALDDIESTDLGLYSPVRGWVLLGEISFWIGTILGLWAIVQGSIAIGTRRGLGPGIAAIVVAVVGPVIFFVVLVLAMGVGAAGSLS
ncbi:MAG: hypothetical protein QM622_02680 [Microbacterium sp.]